MIAAEASEGRIRIYTKKGISLVLEAVNVGLNPLVSMGATSPNS